MARLRVLDQALVCVMEPRQPGAQLLRLRRVWVETRNLPFDLPRLGEKPYGKPLVRHPSTPPMAESPPIWEQMQRPESAFLFIEGRLEGSMTKDPWQCDK